MSSMTTIELTDEEAKQFIAFRQHQDTIKGLLEANIFAVKNGQVILSFSHTGHLMKVETHIIAMTRKSVL